MSVRSTVKTLLTSKKAAFTKPSRATSASERRVCVNGNVEFSLQTRAVAFIARRSLKQTAFALAEVLITLGIIGVVAAVTMPVLISNHNKTVTETRLKKAYNIFSNAIKMSELDNGPMSEWPIGSDLNMDDFWNNYIKPYYVGAELCSNYVACGYPNNLSSKKWSGMQWSLISDETRILFRLNDGTVIFFPKNTTSANGTPSYVSDLYIDINGAKNPNELGRDVFYFKRDYTNGRITATQGDCSKSAKYCTYEIMNNGWKIPDDYPYKI